MARKRTLLAWSLAALGATVLFLLGAFLFLDRTSRGQAWVLTYVLGRLAGAIEGTITVEGVRSPSLTRGATLYGVRLVGTEGRPFLEVDSARATYAARTFLGGDVLLSELVLWQPRLTVSRYPGEATFNADRLFQTDEARPPAQRRIILRNVRLVDGAVEFLEAVDPEDPLPLRMLTVTRPDAPGSLHRMAFQDIQAWMPEVSIAAPDRQGPLVTLDSLSMTGHVYEDPFHLTQLQGTVAWADGALTVTAEELSLQGTRSTGTIVADFTPEGRERGWDLDLRLTSERYALQDLQWLLPTLPDGAGEGAFTVRMSDEGQLRFGFADATLDMDGSLLTGDGWVLNNGEMAFEDVSLRADPLALSRLQPFLEEPLPLDGSVTGRLSLDGPLDRLRAEGLLTLREPDHAPTTAEFSGVFRVGETPDVTDLVAVLEPLDYALLAKLFPDLQVQGAGRVDVRATGSLSGGLTFEAEVLHDPGDLPDSEVRAVGSVRRAQGVTTLDVRADVAPLSITTLRSYYPDLPVSGEVTGEISAVGPLSDLAVTADLATAAGDLALNARFDATDPGAHYQVEGELDGFVLSRLAPDLPEPTSFTGAVRLEGRGTELATATVEAVLSARGSRIGNLDVDTAMVAVRVQDGVFRIDTLTARGRGVTLAAAGTLAATEGGPEGEVRVTFASDSLEALSPVLMGREIRVRDGLSQLEMEAMRAEGIDPDTLPSLEEVAVGGRVRGDVSLRGSLERFSAEGGAHLEDVRYGTSSVGQADVTFTAAGLPRLEGPVHAVLVADTARLAGRAFARAQATLDYSRPLGTVELDLVRDDAEDYRARATFQVDSLGGQVGLEELALRFDTVTWELESPASLTWNERQVSVSGFTLTPAGDAETRITASGILPREGEADFTLQVQSLRMEEVTRLLQQEDLDLSGLVSLDLRVQGTADLPLIEGSLDAAGVRYGPYALDRVAGELDYRDRSMLVDLEAWEADLRVLRATGTVPMDLGLGEVAVRFPDEEIDLTVVADSLPVAFATSLLRDMEAVEGTIVGEFDISGTLQNPSPSGQLVLSDAAWTIAPIGVRHSDVQGIVTLLPDGSVEVEGSARADGTALLTGTLQLDPLSNPSLDLAFTFSNFRAVERRDVLGNISGEVTLRGTYQRSVLEGLRGAGDGLVVESGTLFLEEFVRTTTVVDLTDPRFAGVVDTTLVQTRPILEEVRNPFMDNLRVNIDLAVQQDAWLRSDEMDVEIGGQLKVTFDRASRDIVLVGELQAIRGSYTVLGRRFEVQEGLVEYIGIPGMNPDLNIVAETRVQRPVEPLVVVARVTGTLIQPQVALSSDEPAIGQSDLVSYLLFGRPSYELASGQRAVLEGAAGSFVGAGLGAGVSLLSGTVANRLGSLVAQRWGLDYFAITEVGNLAGDLGSVSQTQVEVGQYLGRDLFLVLAFQPVQIVGANPFSTFGLRLEYTPTDAYTLQAYWEDRFLRSRALGFTSDLATESEKVLGLFLFTEWGY